MQCLILPFVVGLALGGLLRPVTATEPPSPVEQYKEEIKRSQLGPALGVDQGTVERLLEIDRRYKPLKTQLNQEIRAEFARLRQLLSQPAPPEPEVQAVLQSMIRKRQEKLDLEQKQLEEEMTILTPVQQGRYLLFLMGLRRQMVKEAYNLRSLPASPRSPASTLREIPVVQPSH